MIDRLRVLALVVVASGCETGTKELAAIEGPTRVEVWQDKHLANGPWPVVNTNCELHVGATPAFEESIECGHTDLAEDSTGTLIAYRVDKQPAWSLVRLGLEARHFDDCGAPLGTGAKPAFDQVDSLAHAWPRILACRAAKLAPTGSWDGRLADAVTDLGLELRRTSSDAVAAFFTELGRTLPDPVDAQQDRVADPWTQAARHVLTDSELAKVQAAFCGRLIDAAAPARDYVRAARFCPLDTAGVGDTALDRIRRDLASPTLATALDEMAFEWAMVLALRGHASEAGVLGCAYLAHAPPQDTYRVEIRTQLALAAVAVGKTRCPAALAPLDHPACARGDYQCDDDAICSAPALNKRLADWLARARKVDRDGELPRGGWSPPQALVSLAAARAQGPLPRTFQTRLARLDYSVDPGIGPACDAPGKPGIPCTCELDSQHARFCELPLDGSYLPLPGMHCAIRADDRHQKVGAPHHVCNADATATCNDTPDCCAGLACTQSHCQPVP